MKPIYSKGIQLDFPLVLAPLAGYTNVGFRTFMKPFGYGLVVSEMISDFALIYQNKETFKMLETTQEERPVALQLFGGSKESLLQAIPILEKHGHYDYLDLNLGCPVPKVTKSNAGSSWLKKGRESELFSMLEAVCLVSRKPVSVKIRLGWSKEDINVVEVAKLVEKAGVALLAIHGRTRNQMYSGEAEYEWIRQAKAVVSIPVIANGDITTLDKAIECLEKTKADGLMIGRGALGNPYLATQIRTYFEQGLRLPNPTLSMQTQYCCQHYEALKAIKGENRAIQEMRGIAPHYFKGFANVRSFRQEVVTMETEQDFYIIVSKMQEKRREEEKPL